MSIDVNWSNSGSNSGKHFLSQEYGRHVLLDTPSLTALGLPADGSEKFATLVYVINPSGGGSGGDTDTDITRVDKAEDRVDTFTYLDEGTSDERIETITHTSASLGLTYTETFAYEGAPGSYRIASITRS